MRHFLFCSAAILTMAAYPATVAAQDDRISGGNDMGITAPADAFPQEPGSDYFLADYTRYEAYLKKLEKQSDRMKLVNIGKTAEGRDQWMAIVSSPENLARLDEYRDIASRLARAKDLSEEEAAALAAKGKAVVWIDAGLHATETVTTQSQIHVIYRLLSQNDPETLRELDDVIMLFPHDNPDGLDLVADWYMRKKDPKEREFDSIPRLYQKYVGHDNNRDSFMAQMPETENANRVMFREWYPQIIYNQHQTGPAGMVVFVPPFRDPFNYNYNPLVMTTLDEVGSTMHSRLVAEDKPGSGMRSVAPYSTWHNGMFRSIAYFHNSVGLLTEIIGGPTPQRIPLMPDTQLARNDEPMPIAPQEWHLKDSLEYQWFLNRAVLDYASRNREKLLLNFYKMGATNIAKGNKDSWTITPRDVDALKEAAGDEAPPPEEGINVYRAKGRVASDLYSMLQQPENRDPRGYVIPAGQADMPTVVTFLNALIKNGVDVEQATSDFTVGGTQYPAGSYVVKTAQAYRPHVLDMFEPQDHPHDFEYPGGPPKPPYDITGYTLAYQMGIQFDRILDGFDGPFTLVPDLIDTPDGTISGTASAGWLVPHTSNNSFALTNRLQEAGVPVSWIKQPINAAGRDFQPGAIWVPASAAAQQIMTLGADELGVNAYGLSASPTAEMLSLTKPRIGLIDKYGGSMPSGWTRWLLEQYEFPFSVVYPQELDKGDLEDKYDVLIFANGTVPGDEDSLYQKPRESRQPDPQDIPAKYRPWLGEITQDKTVPAIATFAREGGTVITVGSANRLAELIGAPVEAALYKQDGNKREVLDRREFYIPGSLVTARVDNTQPLAFGMPDTVDLFFDNSQSFKAKGSGTTPISWYDSADPLHSGWALGQEKLEDTVAVFDADLGDGKVFMMGPEVTQRAQPYATFKFLFNGLFYGPAATK
ncbi:M14 family metallopeptidase [Altericroceibacterium endophyticum]|uniref:Peptidase n=1 Tax=Altericroceibacterium endophyticum TaxID=1808508 RepID=A0A6I4T6X1_9SPHN|nr:M14 metallopeptidase family protein [Altericroceibacterium endophyticum]MXO66408.1 peptidase [Altericroceibacterium endophyticum]